MTQRPIRNAMIAVVAALLFAGCAELPQRPPPPALEDIVNMAKGGFPDEEIIKRIQASGAVYRLSGSQLAKLKADGVSDKVLDTLKQTEIDDARYREWLAARDRMYGPPYWPYGVYGRHPGWWYTPPFPPQRP